MSGDIYAGLSALKTAFDIAKGLININDATRRNAAIIELQEKILTAQATQSDLTGYIGQLEKQVAELEAWEADKQRYELAELAPGLVCYMVKESMRGGEPPHRLCANCYSDGKKSFLQKQVSGEYYDEYRCNTCGEKIPVDKGDPPQPAPRPLSYF